MRYSKHLTYAERMFLRARLNRVRHITLDPDGPGVVRIHLVPCYRPDRETPFTAILNGQDILPLNVSWAILLTNLDRSSESLHRQRNTSSRLAAIQAQAVSATRKIYRKTEYAQIEERPERRLWTACARLPAARSRRSIEPVSLADYATADGRAPPYGSDGQLNGQGRRVALQPEMPALLCGKPAAFRRAGAGHRPMAGRD